MYLLVPETKKKPMSTVE